MFARQDLKDRFDLLLPSDDQFRFVRTFDHVHTELIQKS